MIGNNRRSDYLVAMYALLERALATRRASVAIFVAIPRVAFGRAGRTQTSLLLAAQSWSVGSVGSQTLQLRSASQPPPLLRPDRCRPPGAAAPIDDARAPLRVERPDRCQVRAS